jgi:glycosyltransferase involved in cell wall biosynthesis
MTAVFAFQHFFFQTDDGRVWSPGQFPSSIWSRYLAHFDRLVVIGRLRGRGATPPPGWVVSNREGVEFVYLPDFTGLRLFLRNFRSYFRILRTTIQSCDVVVSRTSVTGCVASLMAEFIVRRPWALEVVGCAWDSTWNHGRKTVQLSAPFFFLLTRVAVRRCRYCLYVTQRFLQRRYPSARDGFQVGVSDVELDVPSVVPERRPATDRPFTFGLIGSLDTQYKGIQTVLAALPALLREHPNVRFRVLGGGPQEHWRREVARLALGDAVSFDGVRKPGPEVLDWLDSLDTYLQPSFQEGLPRALVEAMSRGLPAIGSTCGGIPELLDEHSLMRPGDVQGLGRLMKKAVVDADWRSRQGLRNWNVAREYDRPALLARRDAFYTRFAQDARKHPR